LLSTTPLRACGGAWLVLLGCEAPSAPRYSRTAGQSADSPPLRRIAGGPVSSYTVPTAFSIYNRPACPPCLPASARLEGMWNRPPLPPNGVVVSPPPVYSWSPSRELVPSVIPFSLRYHLLFLRFLPAESTHPRYGHPRSRTWQVNQANSCVAGHCSVVPFDYRRGTLRRAHTVADAATVLATLPRISLRFVIERFRNSPLDGFAQGEVLGQRGPKWNSFKFTLAGGGPCRGCCVAPSPLPPKARRASGIIPAFIWGPPIDARWVCIVLSRLRLLVRAGPCLDRGLVPWIYFKENLPDLRTPGHCSCKAVRLSSPC